MFSAVSRIGVQTRISYSSTWHTTCEIYLDVSMARRTLVQDKHSARVPSYSVSVKSQRSIVENVVHPRNLKPHTPVPSTGETGGNLGVISHDHVTIRT